MIHIFYFIQMYKNPDENKTTQFILRFKLVKHKSCLIFPMFVYFLHNDNLAVSLISFFLIFWEYCLVISHCHSFRLSWRVNLAIVYTAKKK